MKTREYLTRRDKCRIIGERMAMLLPSQAAKAWGIMARSIEGLWEKDIPKFEDLLKAIRDAQIETVGDIRNWKEEWIDRMGLIVAQSGKERFKSLERFKKDMRSLSPAKRFDLNEAIRLRFTPTNSQDGCQSATSAVREVQNCESEQERERRLYEEDPEAMEQYWEMLREERLTAPKPSLAPAEPATAVPPEPASS